MNNLLDISDMFLYKRRHYYQFSDKRCPILSIKRIMAKDTICKVDDDDSYNDVIVG